MLLITLVGGLVVNILTVIVLALAVLIAHGFSRGEGSGVLHFIVFLTAVLTVLFWRAIFTGRSAGRTSRVIIVIRVFVSLIFLITFLAAVGLAIGVK